MKRTTSATSLLAPPAPAYTRGGAAATLVATTTTAAAVVPPPPPPRRSTSTGAMTAMSPRAFEKAHSNSLDDVSSNNSTASTASCSSTSSYRSTSARSVASSSRSDTRAKDSSSVRVAVRIRPLLPKEIATNERVCVERHANTITVAATDQRFTFDHVFPVGASQTELYNDALEPLMDSFLQGFNVTVIAYGQTGSGKTFTMGNSIAASSLIASRLFSHAANTKSSASLGAAPTVDVLHEGEGLIPRFLFQLFERLKEIEAAGSSSSGSENVVSVSFLEIYGEDIHDLLQPHARQPHDDTSQNLQLRESQAGVWVQGLTEVRVSNRREALEQMRVGSLRRATGSTEMNEHSSRSHAVYTVKIVRRMSRRESLSATTAAALAAQCRRAGADSASPETNETADTTIVSKLTFVDLAGSERLKRTLAEGNRMKEGIQINVGLLALGNVINALGDKKSRSSAPVHVPYRSSKLTRLLQDALGGNSRTLFIACVSPAEANASESLNTLQYANRAKNITNKAVKNIDSRSAEVLGLKAFNALLQRELVKARFIPSTAASDTAMLEDPLLVEAMVDKLLQDAAVQSYLKRLEAMANAVGTDGFVGSRDLALHDVDLSLLAARFTAQVALATVVSAPPPGDLPILAPVPCADASQPERMDEIRMADDSTVKDVVDVSASSALDARAAECEAQLLLSQQTCDERDQTIAHLEATQAALLAQLAARDSEIERLRSRIDELEASLAISKGKEEAFLLLDRCQEVWNELGLNAEDQAGKFQDINALLLKRCSEELEGLESAREQLHLRIDAAYDSVERLERVLHAAERVNLALLPAVAGKTLLAQEKYLLLAQARLEDELRRRYQARTWSLRRIRDLVRVLRLASWRELRHVAIDAMGVQLPELLETLGLLEADDSGENQPASPLPIERLLAIAQDVNLSLSALERDASVLTGLEQEQARRVAEADGELRSIRSALQQMEFTSDELLHVLSNAATPSARERETPETPEESEDEMLQRMLLWILQEGESLGVGTDVLTLLARVRQSLVAICSGRSSAIAHLDATLVDALALGREMLSDASADDARALIMSGDADDCARDGAADCSYAALEAGATRLDALGAPIEASLRALLLSIDDEFTAYGIETDAQRISFFLGSDDDENNATRKTLERYISGARRSSSDDGAADEPVVAAPAPPSTSLLSAMDPAYETLGSVYSPTHSKATLARLADAISDVAVVQRTLASAAKRLASLQQIMKLFNEISEFQKKIGDFEASASRKDRLFGSSLRLLEEEKFRKVAAKRYPSLLAALRKEVAKWLANDDGEFDLSVLGADLKNLLLEMMNTDTELMHLDLGVVDSSRTLQRRQSKSSLTPTPAPSAASQSTTNGHASAPARSRSATMLVRESSAKKRLAFEH